MKNQTSRTPRPRGPATAPAEVARNQARLRELMEQHRVTAAGVAKLLSAAGGRPVARTTVLSWLVDPARPSSYPCPSWAVALLETVIEGATDEHRDRRGKYDRRQSSGPN